MDSPSTSNSPIRPIGQSSRVYQGEGGSMTEDAARAQERFRMRLANNNRRQGSFSNSGEIEPSQTSIENERFGRPAANETQEMFRQKSLAEEEAGVSPEKNGLEAGWFYFALLIAILFDIIGILLVFSGVGPFIASILVTGPGMLIIWGIHFLNGVKVTRKIKSRFAKTAVTEFIPYINALPALTTCVLLSKATPMINNVIDKTAGESSLVSKGIRKILE